MIIKIDKKLASIEKIIDKIKPPIDIDFDIGIVKKLKNSEFVPFRKDFLKLIHALRIKKININYDSIRMQSIKYNVLLIGPQTLSLKISGLCNYKCVFCGTHNSVLKLRTKFFKKHLMPFRDIKNTIDQAYELGTESIYITGSGEPLLHPQILDIISYIEKKGFKIKIFTNASIFKIVSEILKFPSFYKLSFIVNMAAVEPKKFASIHGGNPRIFNRVLKAIKDLNKRYELTCCYILNKDTFGDILPFIKIVHLLGVKNLQLKFLTENNPDYRELACSQKQLGILLRNLNRIKMFCESHQINIDLSEILVFFLQKARQIKIRRCYNGWLYSLVELDGNVYNCCRKNTPLGCMNSGDFKNVFFSPSYRNSVIEGKEGIDIDSENWKNCRFCIFALRNMKIDELNK